MAAGQNRAGAVRRCATALAAVLIAVALQAAPARGAHPLITEDTATQGRGRLQLELQAELGKDKEQGVETDSTDYAAVLTYGVRDNLDVLLTLPYTRSSTRADGTDTTVSGGGDVGVDAKWRFFEKGDFSVALKAGVTYPSGDETQALGAGHWNYSANLVTSYANGPWGYHLHLGYARNRNELDERGHLHHASVAITHQTTAAWRLVADLSNDTTADRNFDEERAFLTLGAIYSVGEDLDLDFGMRSALSAAETDTTLLFGVALRF